MKRRDFLRVAGGAAGGGAVASGAAAAQEENATSSNNTTAANGTATGNETTTGGGGGGGGGGIAETVKVGPGGNLTFEPAKVYVKPGQTVKFVFESDGHNIVVGEQPEGASWEGTPGGKSKLYDTGYTYTHTFQKKGKYHYWCQPHKQAGMVGDVIVNDTGKAPGAGKKTLDPHHMGVPFQAHWVGISTIVMIMVSLVYSFFVLKYGESPNTSGGNR